MDFGEALREQVNAFNARYRPGQRIVLESVRGQPDTRIVRTISNHGAAVLSGHSPVVYVTDGGGCWHLDNVIGLEGAAE